MAVLSSAERLSLWADFMRTASSENQPLPLSKTDLRAAVDAIDDWADANLTEFNNAIPQPSRGALTTKQKSQLLMFVIRRRYEVA